MFLTAPRRIPIGDFRFSPQTIQEFQKIFRTGRVTYGPMLRALEAGFAAIHRRKHGVFCVSGTATLQIALKILRNIHGWADGDEVLVPAMTFVASSNAVLHERLTPVFVEIESDFLDMDPARIEERLTPRTRAIMPVHLFGMPCRMAEIAEIAARHRLVIIEDCCQCTYGFIDGMAVGSWSPMSCFSTYCGSLVFTGVGGLVLTDDADLEVRARKLLAHGRDEAYLNIDADNQLDNPDLLEDVIRKRFQFVDLGFSLRMTEFEGAMGLDQIARIDKIAEQRRQNAAHLIAGLKDLDLLVLPRDRVNARRAYRMFPIQVRGTKQMRNHISFFLERHGVETRPHFPLLDQPYYCQLFGDRSAEYPISTEVSNIGFYIGVHEYLEPADLDYVIEVMHAAVKGL